MRRSISRIDDNVERLDSLGGFHHHVSKRCAHPDQRVHTPLRLFFVPFPLSGVSGCTPERVSSVGYNKAVTICWFASLRYWFNPEKKVSLPTFCTSTRFLAVQTCLKRSVLHIFGLKIVSVWAKSSCLIGEYLRCLISLIGFWVFLFHM